MQVFSTQARIPHDAFEDLGMENSRGMKWNGGSFAFGVLVDHVTATLTRDLETQLFQYGTGFTRG